PSSRRGLCHAPPIGCNLSINRKRKPMWRRCVAASIAVGPSAILTGSRTRPSDWGSNARFGPVEHRRNNRRLATFTCTLFVLQILQISLGQHAGTHTNTPLFHKARSVPRSRGDDLNSDPNASTASRPASLQIPSASVLAQNDRGASGKSGTPGPVPSGTPSAARRDPDQGRKASVDRWGSGSKIKVSVSLLD